MIIIWILFWIAVVATIILGGGFFFLKRSGAETDTPEFMTGALIVSVTAFVLLGILLLYIHNIGG